MQSDTVVWIIVLAFSALMAKIMRDHENEIKALRGSSEEHTKEIGVIRVDVGTLQQAQSDTTRRLTEIQSDVKDTNRKLDEVIIPALLKGQHS